MRPPGWLLLIGLLLTALPGLAQPAAGMGAPSTTGVEATRRPVATDAAAAAGRAPDPRAAAAGPAVPGAGAPLGSLAGVNVDYKIGPNDLIDVEVYGVPDLKRTVRVNSAGVISLALIGSVPVAGFTAQQAEEMIAKRYGEKYLQDPQVSLFIREFTTQRITIEGAVQRPGIYPVTGQVTLLRALALAGGGGQYADMEDIMVFRAGSDGKSETLRYNLERIRRAEIPDPPIQPEDIIVVKRDPRRTALRDSLFRDIVDSINPFSGIGK